ncbi:MAG TPA: LLM class flavin-dependent oxidoreductase, partial [Acidimicrobiales bacterium]|nr:LLM class flavin-dependent oxidoreductase [Acidimicrobiales bacterium]
LGVGAGSHRGEYDAAGADFSTRGRQLDDGIDALRRAWARTEGPYALAPGARPVPVWIGGSSEAALRRAARRGDGWFPLFLGPDDYGAAMDRLDKEAERAGRDPAAVARAIVVFAAVGAHEPGERGLAWMGSLYGLPPSSFARHLVAGDAAHCARVVGRFVEAGADHVAVFVTADDPSVQFEDLAGECAPWAVAGRAPRHHQPADPLRARTV